MSCRYQSVMVVNGALDFVLLRTSSSLAYNSCEELDIEIGV